MIIKSRSILRKERTNVRVEVIGDRKRKFSPARRPPSGSPEVFWIYGKTGYFKDECPFVRCRFYKVLGHRIGECPATLKKKIPPQKLIMQTKEKLAPMQHNGKIKRKLYRAKFHYRGV